MSDWTSYSGKYKLVLWDSTVIQSINDHYITGIDEAINDHYITAKNELTDHKAYILAKFSSRKDALIFMINLIMGVYSIERVVKQIEYDYSESVPIAIERRPVNV